jgi:hypothetical protein
MKRIVVGAVSLLLGVAGCQTMWPMTPSGLKPPPAVMEQPALPPAPPVTAEQITEATAKEKAQKLREVIDRAQSEKPPALPAQPEKE